eukprot:9391098-Ditylum_brightwellii.AAC.1
MQQLEQQLHQLQGPSPGFMQGSPDGYNQAYYPLAPHYCSYQQLCQDRTNSHHHHQPCCPTGGRGYNRYDGRGCSGQYFSSYYH